MSDKVNRKMDNQDKRAIFALFLVFIGILILATDLGDSNVWRIVAIPFLGLGSGAYIQELTDMSRKNNGQGG